MDTETRVHDWDVIGDANKQTNGKRQHKEAGTEKLNSTVQGLKWPSARDEKFTTPLSFLRGRRKDDGAEGLWRVRNGLYDLQAFAKSHPGGAEWIRLTKGTDITELFETHHLTDKAENLLPKFYIRDVATPRSIPLTFEPDGFYRTFKRRALEVLKDVDFHRPSTTTNLITDSLLLATFVLSIWAARTQCYLTAFAAAVFFAWTTIAGHNYLHMRDNFRMYYFDLSLMSSKEWRITHAMSHHMYPNTLWDYEIYAAEPFLHWLPYNSKSLIRTVVSQLISPVVWLLTYVEQGLKRYYSVFYEYGTFEFRDAVPFVLPATMSFFAPSVGAAVNTWLLIVLLASLVFGYIGFNAAHHHPDIFHDGDVHRDDLDWGLLEVDALREREVIDDSAFLALTNFGAHALHHLLPTVDHSYLLLLVPAFLQTCKEFGVSTKRYTYWEMIKGQFQQLARRETKKNVR